MKITVWQNESFENEAKISDWAKEKNHALEVYKTYETKNLTFSDALIILGGSLSAYDNVDFLNNVKTHLDKAITQNIKIYGICLGSQLLAQALGARVYPSNTREIGWRYVEFENDWQDMQTKTVFHWHGDTFDLPDCATRLASNDAFLNQAFSANEGNIIATQFHFETTSKSVTALYNADKEYLNFNSPYINKNIFEDSHFESAHKALYNALDRWIKP